MTKGTERTVIPALTIRGVGGYFMQRQRSYSSASVYITEPALPVLMWSCA